jgi:hypothetical protein
MSFAINPVFARIPSAAAPKPAIAQNVPSNPAPVLPAFKAPQFAAKPEQPAKQPTTFARLSAPASQPAAKSALSNSSKAAGVQMSPLFAALSPTAAKIFNEIHRVLLNLIVPPQPDANTAAQAKKGLPEGGLLA